jgi:hypothetical protein
VTHQALLICHMHVAYAVCRSAEGQGAVSKEAAQLGYGSLLGYVAGMLLGEALKDKQVGCLHLLAAACGAACAPTYCCSKVPGGSITQVTGLSLHYCP